MLQEIFYWIFNMSITAWLTGMVIMLIRSIRRIPRRVVCFLWLIPFIRMVLPFGVNTDYGLMGIISELAKRPTIVLVSKEAEFDSFASFLNHAQAKYEYYPQIVYKSDTLDNVFAAASVVWIIVALAVMLMLVTVYFTTMRQIKSAKRVEGNVYTSSKVDTPGVYGIISPRILLPLKYKAHEPDVVLLHERMHVRRGDNLWRMLAFLVVAVHWFNPLAWVFLRLVMTDLELACDEAVLASPNAPDAKSYASALLEYKSSPTLFASAFGGARIKVRIENILSYKKMTVCSSIAFLFMALAIAAVLLTN